MLKAFCLTAVLSTTLIPVLAEIAASRPIPGGSSYSVILSADMASTRSPSLSSKYPGVPDSDINQPVCYMQTADNRVVNLSSLCKQKPVQQAAQQPAQQPEEVNSNSSAYICDPLCKPL